MPVLRWADTSTRLDWPSPDCTSSPGGKTAAVESRKGLKGYNSWGGQCISVVSKSTSPSRICYFLCKCRVSWAIKESPLHLCPTSPSVQSSMMIQTGFSVITPISFTMWGWSNWRMVTAKAETVSKGKWGGDLLCLLPRIFFSSNRLNLTRFLEELFSDAVWSGVLTRLDGDTEDWVLLEGTDTSTTSVFNTLICHTAGWVKSPLRSENLIYKFLFEDQ